MGQVRRCLGSHTTGPAAYPGPRQPQGLEPDTERGLPPTLTWAQICKAHQESKASMAVACVVLSRTNTNLSRAMRGMCDEKSEERPSLEK